MRPAPFYLGIAYGVLGLASSIIVVRDTRGHVQHQAANHADPAQSLSFREVFRLTTIGDRNLFAVSQVSLGRATTQSEIDSVLNRLRAAG